MEKKPSSPKSVLSHIIDFLLKEGLTLITGAALGAIIALTLSYEDATAFWGMVGSLLAGLGTVGLLAFGWVKADDWISNISSERNLRLVDSISSQTMSLWYFFQLRAINFDDEKEFDYADFSRKITNLNHSIEVYKAQFGEDQFYININEKLKAVLEQATPIDDKKSSYKRNKTRDLYGELYKVTQDECKLAYTKILKR